MRSYELERHLSDFALHSFAPGHSIRYVPLLQEYPKFLRAANRSTPVLAIHGFEDPMVRVIGGK